MDVEHLTKTQIVLLALLCTFVASIATGIVTVALLAQAPPAVPQTINHIIQRTVETVAPSVTTGEPTPTTVKETTVVVKEDELLSGAISTSFAKLGVVHEGLAATTPVVGLGIPVGQLLITDATVVAESHGVEFGDTVLTYTVEARFAEVGVAVLRLTDGGKAPTGFRIADTGQTKLGQSVVTLPSAAGTRVGIGAVTARYVLGRAGEKESPIEIRAIETNMSGRTMAGAPLLNAFGDVLGVSTGISQSLGSEGTFVALSDLAPLFTGVRGTSTASVVP